MSHVHSVRPSPLRWALLGACATVLALPAAATAQVPGAENKTPVDMTVSDAAGDVSLGIEYSDEEEASIDIVSATTHQDRVASRLDTTVTFAGLQPVNYAAQVRVAFGNVDARNFCQITDYGAVHLIAEMQTGHNKAVYAVATQNIQWTDIPMTRGTNTISMSTPVVPGMFDGRAWNCVRVSTEPAGNDYYKNVEDEATGYLPAPDPAPPAVPAPVAGGTAAILDADGDGIHDGADKCPQVAGAATTGCETTSLAKSIKLGTKRVVIDRLLAKTGTTCPIKVTAVVTLGKKRIGLQPLGTTMHGKFCQAVGVVKLKKRASKVKVVIKGSGVTAISATVKK